MSDYTPYGPVLPLHVASDGSAQMCKDCGAVVIDQRVHDRFHSILDSHAWALAVLKGAHLAPHVHDKYKVVEKINSKKFDNWSADAFAEVTGLDAAD